MPNLITKRIIKSGVQNFKRQGNLSFATISILVITISLIAFVYISHGILGMAIANIREKADISVYFQKQSSEDKIFELREKLTEFPQINGIEYVSEDEALERFIEKHKGEKALMESLQELGANPFLASLNIRAQEVDSYEKVVSFLENESYSDIVEKIDFYRRKSTIERIFNITSFIDKTGFLVSFILILASSFLVYNTIRLTIYTQKQEIGISRLVGASNWFVRGPFLVQAALCGISAFFITFLLIGFFSYFLGPKISSFFPEINILSFFGSNFRTIILTQLISGLLLGIVPSFLAIRKYLEI